MAPQMRPSPLPPVNSLEAFPPLASSAAAEGSALPAKTRNAPPEPISFAAIVSRDKIRCRFPDVPLSARQYGTKNGVPSINFSLTEHQALTQRISHTVIAKFQGVRPPLTAIKTHVESNWKIKGTFSMSPNWDGRHVVFLLDSEEDVNAALVCPSRRVQLSFFRLFRWTPDYNPKKESTRVTKWLKLPGLPMEFFTRSCVKAIVSSFAHFLDIDDRTFNMSSLHCARACVELDVTGKVPSRVLISVGEHSFFQDIVVEGGIAYCSKCKKHGHDVATCKKMAKSHTVVPEGNVLAPSEGDNGKNHAKKYEEHDSNQQIADDSIEVLPSGPTIIPKEKKVIPHTSMEAPECEQGENSKMSPEFPISEHLAMVVYNPMKSSLAAAPVISGTEAASESVSPPISEWTRKKRKNKGKKPSLVTADHSFSTTELPITCLHHQAISSEGSNSLCLRQSSRSKKSSENSDFVYHVNGKKTGKGKARKKVSFTEFAEVMNYEEG